MKKSIALSVTALSLVAGLTLGNASNILPETLVMPLTAKAATTTSTQSVTGDLVGQWNDLSVDFSTIAATFPTDQVPQLTWQDLIGGVKSQLGNDLIPILNYGMQYINGIKTGQQAFDASQPYVSSTNPGILDNLADYEKGMTSLLSQFKGSTINAAALQQNLQGLMANSPKNAQGQPILSVPFTTNNVTVTIQYLKPDGTKAADDKVVPGYLGEAPIDIPSPTVTGFTPDQANVSVAFNQLSTTITVHYSDNNAPAGGSTVTPPSSTTGSGQTGTTAGDQPQTPAVNPGMVVYGINNLYLYQKATFHKTQRLAFFARKARLDRPMFVVLKTVKSASNQARYLVRDVNPTSKTYNHTGYVTTNSGYVQPVYETSTPQKATVISTGGVNTYKTASLATKVAHHPQGTVLAVKKIVNYHLTTRFELTDGTYVSANKKLVMAGTHKLPSTVVAKQAVNVYRSPNLTGKKQHDAKKHTFKVLGYAYSNTGQYTKGSTLRYRVAGGYITANPAFVKYVK